MHIDLSLQTRKLTQVRRAVQQFVSAGRLRPVQPAVLGGRERERGALRALLLAVLKKRERGRKKEKRERERE